MKLESNRLRIRYLGAEISATGTLGLLAAAVVFGAILVFLSIG